MAATSTSQQASTLVGTPSAPRIQSHPSQSTLPSYTQRPSSSSRSHTLSSSTYYPSHPPSGASTAPINIPGRQGGSGREYTGEEEDEEDDESEGGIALRNECPEITINSGHDPSRITPEPTSDAMDASMRSPTGSPIQPSSPRLRPTHPSNLSLSGSGAGSPTRIRVRDLSHIQSFASEEVLTRSRYGSRRSLRSREGGLLQYEISEMPVTDIIEMVAGLLTKITLKNDNLHEHLRRNIPTFENTSALSEQTASVYSFHGKNVPTITILSYLTRIHKYCPTTYEVFLSLLVYFDRMTDTINRGTLHSFQGLKSSTDEVQADARDVMDDGYTPSLNSSPASIDGPTEPVTPPASGSIRPQRILTRSDVRVPPTTPGSSAMPNVPSAGQDPDSISKYFVVDSFNIHRLVIAGVTCASKFFSDVFYTNSRYAKVGGLPINELNHLELQFLLLNDFRLAVPVEELEAYGSMLVEFYAEEVIKQQSANPSTYTTPTTTEGGLFMSSADLSARPTRNANMAGNTGNAPRTPPPDQTPHTAEARVASPTE